jgi:hypothetical protein
MNNVLIGAKIEPELKKLVQTVSRQRGEDESSFVRRSIRKELASLGYMPEETLRALGIEKVPKSEA